MSKSIARGAYALHVWQRGIGIGAVYHWRYDDHHANHWVINIINFFLFEAHITYEADLIHAFLHWSESVTRTPKCEPVHEWVTYSELEREFTLHNERIERAAARRDPQQKALDL